ncbi:DUF456 domain-containing protein [Leptolyngbya sp. BL0902]|uniref:DUF456 domain-containing protein n=1 Tax=Leptolyngbya sp. BL0902 TaxID=1115757 RepID=UPI0021F23654|nr:DUF456 family protein [Leptolyngbya sp. BL0902]
MFAPALPSPQSIGVSLGAFGSLPISNVIAQVTPTAWVAPLYGLLLLVMVVGVVGAVVPALPGISLVLGAVIVWGFVVGFSSLKWALGVTIVATVLSVLIDYLAGVLGAQRVGASTWGQVGAFIGMFLGLFGLLPLLPTGIPLLGLLLGTVLGAFIGEFLYRRELALGQRMIQSGKVGIAIVVGTLVGNVLQGVLALIAFVVFVATTWQGVWALM